MKKAGSSRYATSGSKARRSPASSSPRGITTPATNAPSTEWMPTKSVNAAAARTTSSTATTGATGSPPVVSWSPRRGVQVSSLVSKRRPAVAMTARYSAPPASARYAPPAESCAVATTTASSSHAHRSSTAAQASAMVPSRVPVSPESWTIQARIGNAVTATAAARNNAPCQGETASVK
ncbi:Uncharacterised protein [Mycobacteroides abscessus subsp. abscessus]|nr:Uncharacterised protein [Mycobacteroides abscessus subsp. abscessus]